MYLTRRYLLISDFQRKKNCHYARVIKLFSPQKRLIGTAKIRASVCGVQTGIDGLKVNDLPAYMAANWEQIKAQLLNATYVPQTVRGVEIPKPNGKKRLLGIPTVMDRVIQQAVNQVLMPIWEKEFSPYSYGFRPNKSAHHALLQAKDYINEDRKFIISLDLEKFFDKVNHDKLMGLIRRKITDKRLLCLIRKFLKTGILIGGNLEKREKGTPQGGFPLSPLLSNILLNELDQEMTKRGLSFVRYAEDVNIQKMEQITFKFLWQ